LRYNAALIPPTELTLAVAGENLLLLDTLYDDGNLTAFLRNQNLNFKASQD